MEHAIKFICFFNYLPCAKLLFALILIPCLVRLCFCFCQYNFLCFIIISFLFHTACHVCLCVKSVSLAMPLVACCVTIWECLTLSLCVSVCPIADSLQGDLLAQLHVMMHRVNSVQISTVRQETFRHCLDKEKQKEQSVMHQVWRVSIISTSLCIIFMQ